jgi:beta-phosphoglucomutase-like phosphatase (HAD superfamily)
MPATPKYPRLPPREQTGVLRSIVGRCRPEPSGRTSVVVFDLDGTLMDNRPRTCAILREFAETLGPDEREIAARLHAAKPDELAYLLTDTLAKLGISRTDLVGRAETFWRDRFFADAHLRHDVEVPGAVAFARACYDAGAILVYMTGRDLPMMGLGSFRSLRDLGFPIGVAGTELVLKPDASMPDEAFKRLEAPKLARVGKIVAVFDNEPANCNTLLAMNPGCDSVLLDTQHLPGAPPIADGVRVICDFVMS